MKPVSNFQTNGTDNRELRTMRLAVWELGRQGGIHGGGETGHGLDRCGQDLDGEPQARKIPLIKFPEEKGDSGEGTSGTWLWPSTSHTQGGSGGFQSLRLWTVGQAQRWSQNLCGRFLAQQQEPISCPRDSGQRALVSRQGQVLSVWLLFHTRMAGCLA